MSQAVQKFRARMLFSGRGDPIENAMLTVGASCILDTGPFDGSAAIDLGDVAVIPGLINAHTHLEFSDLAEPLGQRGVAFTRWIELLLEYRAHYANRRPDGQSQTVDHGLTELAENGTVAVGEIASQAWPESVAIPPDLCVVEFLERMGNDPESHDSVISEAESYLRAERRAKNRIAGISPHAPYSVPLALLERLVRLSVGSNCAVAMHLAETREELELLKSGSGPLVELLQKLGAWYPDQFSGKQSVLDFLALMTPLKRVLIVHGNYLGQAEIEYITRHRNSMHVVYCPRTHTYFGHQNHPLRKLLDAGINVALGTDSRASNPDLSVWSEARHVLDKHRSVSPGEAFVMATRAGADALGLDAGFGTIVAGQRARLNTIDISRIPSPTDPYAALFEANADPRPLHVNRN